MHIFSGVVGNIVNCGVVDCEGAGFDIWGHENFNSNGRVKVLDSRIKGCGTHGVLCHNGGVATIQNVLAVGNPRSYGCIDSGSSLKLIECEGVDSEKQVLQKFDGEMVKP